MIEAAILFCHRSQIYIINNVIFDEEKMKLNLVNITNEMAIYNAYCISLCCSDYFLSCFRFGFSLINWVYGYASKFKLSLSTFSHYCCIQAIVQFILLVSFCVRHNRSLVRHVDIGNIRISESLECRVLYVQCTVYSWIFRP